MTIAEAFLWRYLKNKQIEGRRFRRQFSIGNYILDFYCFELQLGIELDGQPHFTDEGLEKDKERTAELNKHGVEIIRFENQLVFTHTETVLQMIRDKIVERSIQQDLIYPSVTS